MVLFLNSKKLLSLRDQKKGGELRTGSKQAMSPLLRVWGEGDITDTSKGLAQPFAAGTANALPTLALGMRCSWLLHPASKPSKAPSRQDKPSSPSGQQTQQPYTSQATAQQR